MRKRYRTNKILDITLGAVLICTLLLACFMDSGNPAPIIAGISALIIVAAAIIVYKRLREENMRILKATTYDADNPTPVTRQYEVYDNFKPREYVSDISRAGDRRVVFDSEPKMIRQKLSNAVKRDFIFYRIEWSVYDLTEEGSRRKNYTRFVCIPERRA